MCIYKINCMACVLLPAPPNLSWSLSENRLLKMASLNTTSEAYIGKKQSS